jgi:hypothetical protein
MWGTRVLLRRSLPLLGLEEVGMGLVDGVVGAIVSRLRPWQRRGGEEREGDGDELRIKA